LQKGRKYENKERIDIVLSPEFYWIKKIEFDIKNIRSAKKISPSLFEGSLPHNNFSFKVLKQDRNFYAIAYDINEIKEEIENSGLNINSVKKLYFTQKEFENIDKCIKLDDFYSLAKIENIWTKIPKICSEESVDIENILNNLKLSNFFVTLSKKNEITIDKKLLKGIFVILVLLVASQVVELFSYNKELIEIEKKEKKILQDYSLPATMIQLRSIEKRLDKKLKMDLAKKELLKFISKLSIKGSKIKRLVIKKEEVLMEIEDEKEDIIENLKKEIEKSYKILKVKKNKNIFKVWWRYE